MLVDVFMVLSKKYLEPHTIPPAGPKKQQRQKEVQ
jgi:hypothetical protein